MMEDRSSEDPDLMEVEGAVGTGEPVLEEAMEGTGGMPVQETGAGDLHFEDYPGDDFEKVGEYTQEETSQTPLILLLNTLLNQLPPAPNRGRRGLKLSQGGQSFPGSASWLHSKPKPLRLLNKFHQNSLPNQPVNPTA